MGRVIDFRSIWHAKRSDRISTFSSSSGHLRNQNIVAERTGRAVSAFSSLGFRPLHWWASNEAGTTQPQSESQQMPTLQENVPWLAGFRVSPPCSNGRGYSGSCRRGAFAFENRPNFRCSFPHTDQSPMAFSTVRSENVRRYARAVVAARQTEIALSIGDSYGNVRGSSMVKSIDDRLTPDAEHLFGNNRTNRHRCSFWEKNKDGRV